MCNRADPSAVNAGSMLMLFRALTALRRPDDNSGVTAIEYALIASLIAMVIIVAVVLLGTTLSGLYGDIADATANS